MFEKLLSLLPYNPSLGHQLAFYGRRTHEEAAVRRVGLVLVALAFLVQFFAVISPPQATASTSTSDLINGGFTTKAEAFQACTDNAKQYATILANYGISCSDINAATTATIKSTAFNNTLYTLGWNPDGSFNHRTNKPTNEVAVNLLGLSRPVYWHLVSNQDTAAFSTYKVLQIAATKTRPAYYILFHCGNLVSIKVPVSIKLCPYNAAIFVSDARCHPPVCPQNNSIYVTDKACVGCPYDKTIIKSDKRCVPCPNPRYPTVSATNPQCKPVCTYNNAFDQGDANCKPCTASQTVTDALACVQVSKTASDPTQNLPDANNKTAQPGDTIIYTLYAKNTGKAVVPDFVMEENLSDVLDYADVVDLNGGAIDQASGEVTWPATDIKAGATLSHQITVKVKASIPQTPASISDGSHFDLVMTNVYGNAINIDVPGSPIHTIAATTLVNTGPGTGLFAAAAVVMLAGYFYARARLLAKESSLALHGNVGV